MKKIFIFLLLVLGFLFLDPLPANAFRNSSQITDWYIDNFRSNIVVNKDSSLLIMEIITADCGNLPNKHGIFRVLPTQVKTDSGAVYKSPIELVGITDLEVVPYKYQTIKSGDTITWKIGDANKTVTGVNYYKIVYKVKNAIRFTNPDSPEFYWNLSGNFWDIDIDSFSAQIFLPPEVNQQDTEIYYYTGYLGAKEQSLASYSWQSDGSLTFNSVAPFKPRQGITASIILPEGIFTPYQPTFWEKYGSYFSLLIPLFIFIASFLIWKKFGKDPKMQTPIPPEFGIPENITPAQMGMVISSGIWRDTFMTATIIDLAVKKFIVIDEMEQKILFFTQKTYFLKKAENFDKRELLSQPELKILDSLFSEKTIVNLNQLKTERFYTKIPAIRKSALGDVAEKGWVIKAGVNFKSGFILVGILFLITSFFMVPFFAYGGLFISILISAVIVLAFAPFMKKRTREGTDLLFKIKGFERYMRQAEDYRQQFYEKENIFDKFLPYAIVFGIADLWAKKMEQIYGKDFYNNYHPAWFTGAAIGTFNINSFTSHLNAITSSISSSTGTSSGAGGGGGSGGGGGGGGGGGW